MMGGVKRPSWPSIGAACLLVVFSYGMYAQGQDSPESSYRIDVLQAIGLPLPSGVSFGSGIQDTAFIFEEEYVVGRMAEVLFPAVFSDIFPEFSIHIVIKPFTTHVGPIFSLTNKHQSVIVLGVNISEAGPTHNKVSLYLTTLSSSESQEVANFIVPLLQGKWSQLSFGVQGNVVKFYFNCSRVEEKEIFYKPVDFQITSPHGAILIGSLGYQIEPRIKYTGYMQEVLITSKASHARTECSGFEFFASGSGDFSGEGSDYSDSSMEFTPTETMDLEQVVQNTTPVSPGKATKRKPGLQVAGNHSTNGSIGVTDAGASTPQPTVITQLVYETTKADAGNLKDVTDKSVTEKPVTETVIVTESVIETQPLTDGIAVPQVMTTPLPEMSSGVTDKVDTTQVVQLLQTIEVTQLVESTADIDLTTLASEATTQTKRGTTPLVEELMETEIVTSLVEEDHVLATDAPHATQEVTETVVVTAEGSTSKTEAGLATEKPSKAEEVDVPESDSLDEEEELVTVTEVVPSATTHFPLQPTPPPPPSIPMFKPTMLSTDKPATAKPTDMPADAVTPSASGEATVVEIVTSLVEVTEPMSSVGTVKSSEGESLTSPMDLISVSEDGSASGDESFVIFTTVVEEVYDEATTASQLPIIAKSTSGPGTPEMITTPTVTGAKGDEGVVPTVGPGMKGEQGLQGQDGAKGEPGMPGLNGTNGEKGMSGQDGMKGEPGMAGLNGTKGDKGMLGQDGMKGEPGMAGVNGTNGIQGPKGDKGDAGLEGLKGEEGQEGLPGVSGPPGDTGIKGELGETGMKGQKGEEGEDGVVPTFNPADLVGPKGDKGLKGSRGKYGPQGPTGPRGFPGDQGDRGEQGIKGEKGDPAGGIPGLAGPPGPAGPQGTQGLPGIGPDGPQGEPGPIGEKGDRGVQGPRGHKGVEGPIGIQGPIGGRGLPGKDGNCSCQAGLDGKDGVNGTDGAPGTQGEIGPAGEKGDRGEQGEQGHMGRHGLDGMPGDHGLRGPQGPPGPPGPTGQIPEGWKLVPQNTTDTEDGKEPPLVIETIPGSQGPPGPDGEAGAPGLSGPRGPEGERGEKGSSGLPGPRGIKGDQGIEGPEGPQGPPGTDGPKGMAGPIGSPGEIGLPGPRGSKGENGDPGISIEGPPGSPGLAGPRGIKGLKGEVGPPGPGMNISVSDIELFSNLEKHAEILNKLASGSLNLNGTKGEPGKEGPPGFPGLSGLSGVQGPPGPEGPVGFTGPRGLKGTAGDHGEDGLPGLPGPVGPQGPKGEVYIPNKDELITVKGDPGERGIRGKRGAKGHFGIPGFPGAPGRRGTQGYSGPPGAPGPTGPPGLPGRGQKGDRGAPGPSSAVNGLGTKGDKGDMGYPGFEGPQGPQGEPGFGFDGNVGPTGDPGTKGQKGEPGDSSGYGAGAKGEPGPQGPQGPPGIGMKGMHGDPGLPGPEGQDGIGIMGHPGFPGPKGPRGSPGPPGPAGSGHAPSPDNGQHAEMIKYSSLSEMLEYSGRLDVGTLAFIIDDEEIYVRVRGGMQQVMLGATFRVERPTEVRSTSKPAHMPSPKSLSTESLSESLSTTPKVSKYTPSQKYTTTKEYITPTQKLVNTEKVTTEIVRIPSSTSTEAPYPSSSSSTSEPYTTPTQSTTEASSTSMTSMTSTTLTPTYSEFPDLPGPDLQPADDPSLHLYALNEPLKGHYDGSFKSLKGLSGADRECYKQSKAAGLEGTYRAFLSSRLQDIREIVREGDRRIPIKNGLNEVLFNEWNAMFDGDRAAFNGTLHIYSFDGKDVMGDKTWPEKYIWHGSYSDGQRMIESYCEEWRTSNKNAKGQASPLQRHELLGQRSFRCKKALAVLCIQVARPGL